MSNTWISRKGWFTLVAGPSGLQVLEIPKAETKTIRDLGGVLFDLEGASDLELRLHGQYKNPRFVQYKKHRLLIPPKLCDCQYTGWKGKE